MDTDLHAAKMHIKIYMSERERDEKNEENRIYKALSTMAAE